MKKLVLSMLLCGTGILHAQRDKPLMAVYVSPFHLFVNSIQVNFEAFLNENNGLVLGVNFQGKNTVPDNEGIANGEVEIYHSSMMGVMFDLNHKFYTSIYRDRSVHSEKNYLALFIQHGPSYRYQEHEYEVEVFQADENFELRFREGKVYDYITNLGYTVGVGFQFKTYNDRFILETFMGGKFQYSWINESPYLNEQYDEEFYDYGYRGVIPQVFFRLGFIIFNKERDKL